MALAGTIEADDLLSQAEERLAKRRAAVSAPAPDVQSQPGQPKAIPLSQSQPPAQPQPQPSAAPAAGPLPPMPAVPNEDDVLSQGLQQQVQTIQAQPKKEAVPVWESMDLSGGQTTGTANMPKFDIRRTAAVPGEGGTREGIGEAAARIGTEAVGAAGAGAFNVLGGALDLVRKPVEWAAGPAPMADKISAYLDQKAKELSGNVQTAAGKNPGVSDYLAQGAGSLAPFIASIGGVKGIAKGLGIAESAVESYPGQIGAFTAGAAATAPTGERGKAAVEGLPMALTFPLVGKIGNPLLRRGASAATMGGMAAVEGQPGGQVAASALFGGLLDPGKAREPGKAPEAGAALEVAPGGEKPATGQGSRSTAIPGETPDATLARAEERLAAKQSTQPIATSEGAQPNAIEKRQIEGRDLGQHPGNVEEPSASPGGGGRTAPGGPVEQAPAEPGPFQVEAQGLKPGDTGPAAGLPEGVRFDGYQETGEGKEPLAQYTDVGGSKSTFYVDPAKPDRGVPEALAEMRQQFKPSPAETAPQAPRDRATLEGMRRTELVAQAKAAGVKGFSGKSKADLVDMLAQEAPRDVPKQPLEEEHSGLVSPAESDRWDAVTEDNKKRIAGLSGQQMEHVYKELGLRSGNKTTKELLEFTHPDDLKNALDAVADPLDVPDMFKAQEPPPAAPGPEPMNRTYEELKAYLSETPKQAGARMAAEASRTVPGPEPAPVPESPATGTQPPATAKGGGVLKQLGNSIADAVTESGIVREQQGALARAISGAPTDTRGLSERISDKMTDVKDSLARMGGKTFPRITKWARATSEAMTKVISARETGYYKTKHWNADLDAIRQGADIPRSGRVKFLEKAGAMMTEGDLRGVRQQHIEAGDPDAAGQVTTTIRDQLKPRIDALEASGNPDDASFLAQLKKMYAQSPFETEADYQAALKDPVMKRVVEFHKTHPAPWLEENYRASAKIDPETEPIHRNADLDTHMSLMPNMEEGAPTRASRRAGTVPKSTLENHSILERAAKGNGAYELNLSKMYANALHKSIVPGAYSQAVAAAQKDGVGIVASPKEMPDFNGRGAVAFPLKFQDRTFITKNAAGETNTFTKRDDQVLWIRRDLADEWRKSLNIDRQPKIFPQIFTTIQLRSGVEAISHIINGSTVLIQNKGKLAIIRETASDIYRQIVNDPRMAEEMAKASEEGYINPIHGPGSKWDPTAYPARAIGAVVRGITNTIRLQLGREYDRLAAERPNEFDGSAAQRRDFGNMAGQYHPEAQADIVRMARSTGLGPFATAGSNMYANVVRNILAFKPAVTPETWGGSARLRVEMAARVASIMAVPFIANYLRKGQAVPQGMRPGALWLHDDEDGHPVSSDIFAEVTGVRRALRATGMDNVIEGVREGRSTKDIENRAGKQALSAAIGPYIGAVPTGIIEAATGVNPHGIYRMGHGTGPGLVVPNLIEAAKELNPSVAAQLDQGGGGIASQAGKLAPQKGHNFEEIAKIRAQGADVPETARELSSLHSALARKKQTGPLEPDEEDEFQAVRGFYSRYLAGRKKIAALEVQGDHDGAAEVTAQLDDDAMTVKALLNKPPKKRNLFSLLGQ